ncbi:MAG: Uma2 family endonuclease [Dehalococcoidia bacterium]|nr:Uma2 family endonuclease [Dehalococcoidia bacterium]
MAIRRPGVPAPRVPVSKHHGRRMTEEEYLALPEEKPYLEYVDGLVLQKPMPDRLHAQLVMFLDYLIYSYILVHGGRGGPELRLRLPDGSGYRLADTAYWGPGRDMSETSMPTLAVEVRSEEQTMAELRRKCRAFRANGVDICWLIDPYARTVEVFDADRDGVQLGPGEALETTAMPEFTVAQADLWAALDR